MLSHYCSTSTAAATVAVAVVSTAPFRELLICGKLIRLRLLLAPAQQDNLPLAAVAVVVIVVLAGSGWIILIVFSTQLDPIIVVINCGGRQIKLIWWTTSRRNGTITIKGAHINCVVLRINSTRQPYSISSPSIACLSNKLMK